MKKSVVIISAVCLALVITGAIVLGINCSKNNGNNSSEYSSVEQGLSSSSTPDHSGNPDQGDPGQGFIPNGDLAFSNENASKVNTTATFDISKYTQTAGANLRPYPLFGSGMCIQRDAVNRIWGDALKAEHVAVQINDNVYYGSVADNKFEIYLPKMQAGGPYTMTFVSEAGRTVFTEVYIGEVFLLSGQSNMEMVMLSCGEYLASYYATPDCSNDKIRMMRAGWETPNVPTTTLANYCTWTGANQKTIAQFPAVGYLFGKQMQEKLGCPVGLIANPVGGSSIEFWLSDANVQKVRESYTPYVDGTAIMTPSLGYNGMLYFLSGINLRGMVWYQGESNAFGTQQYYDVAFKIFLDQCRSMFNNPKMIFTVCQLARFQSNPFAYSVVNERINEVAKNDPYVVVARNLDQGDWFDIHPKAKEDLGNRTAYETLRVFFNSGADAPIEVESYSFNEDGSVTVNLTRDASLVNGSNGFEVYVGGKYTYDCNVTVSGKQLTITANGAITKVRYGYTCKMTADIQQDVSKMVTVYDSNGFPLDLFLIEKDESEVEAPTLSAGYCDQGYEILPGEGNDAFIVKKYSRAGIWEGAMLEVANYTSTFSTFSLKFNSQNVTQITIELIIAGGEADWAENVTVYQGNLTNGEGELFIDFTAVEAVSKTTWSSVPGKYIKDYQIVAVKIALDTADPNNLIKEDATLTIHDLTFKELP